MSSPQLMPSRRCREPPGSADLTIHLSWAVVPRVGRGVRERGSLRLSDRIILLIITTVSFPKTLLCKCNQRHVCRNYKAVNRNLLTQRSQQESACGQVRSPCQHARQRLACSVHVCFGLLILFAGQTKWVFSCKHYSDASYSKCACVDLGQQDVPGRRITQCWARVFLVPIGMQGWKGSVVWPHFRNGLMEGLEGGCC